ncbi:MAG: hypothetical protein ACLQQ4_16715 [Bacteroidia bacterium]
MKTKLLLFFLVFFGLANAQYIVANYDDDLIKELKAGPLYILPSGDKAFDDSLVSAVKKYWKICESKVPEPSEINNLLKDEKNIFIAPSFGFNKYYPKAFVVNVSTYIIKHTDSPQEAIQLNIFHGDKHNKGTDNIYSIPLNFVWSYFLLYDIKLAGSGIGCIVKNLNDNVQITIDKKIKIRTYYLDDYGKIIKPELSKHPGALKTKTLLVDKAFVDFYLPEKTLSGYKYQYKIMSASEIAAILNSPDCKNYCFLADEWYPASLEIYDGETMDKIWSGETAGMGGKINDKLISALNQAIEKGGSRK